jgi:hypothetical protein
MSLYEFSQDKYVKTFDTDEEIRMGSFKVQDSGFLGTIRANIFIQNVFDIVGTEVFQMNIYSDENYQTKLTESVEVPITVIDISPEIPLKTCYLGYLKFDFNQINLNKNYTHYCTVKISGYARTGAYYIGLIYDYPDPVYDNSEPAFFDHPIAMQVFTYRGKL